MKKLIFAFLLTSVIWFGCKSDINDPDEVSQFNGYWSSFEYKADWYVLPLYLELKVENGVLSGIGYVNKDVSKHYYGEPLNITSSLIQGNDINFNCTINTYDNRICVGDFRGRIENGIIKGDFYVGGLIYCVYLHKVERDKFLSKPAPHNQGTIGNY